MSAGRLQRAKLHSSHAKCIGRERTNFCSAGIYGFSFIFRKGHFNRFWCTSEQCYLSRTNILKFLVAKMYLFRKTATNKTTRAAPSRDMNIHDWRWSNLVLFSLGFVFSPRPCQKLAYRTRFFFRKITKTGELFLGHVTDRWMAASELSS